MAAGRDPRKKVGMCKASWAYIQNWHRVPSATFYWQSKSQVEPTCKGWWDRLHLLMGKLSNSIAKRVDTEMSGALKLFLQAISHSCIFFFSSLKSFLSYGSKWLWSLLKGRDCMLYLSTSYFSWAPENTFPEHQMVSSYHSLNGELIPDCFNHFSIHLFVLTTAFFIIATLDSLPIPISLVGTQ